MAPDGVLRFTGVSRVDWGGHEQAGRVGGHRKRMFCSCRWERVGSGLERCGLVWRIVVQLAYHGLALAPRHLRGWEAANHS